MSFPNSVRGDCRSEQEIQKENASTALGGLVGDLNIWIAEHSSSIPASVRSHVEAAIAELNTALKDMNQP